MTKQSQLETFSIIWGTRRISYAQINIYIASAIKYLKGVGIKPGSRLAIYAENSVEYVILLLALWQMKVIAAPINPKWPKKLVDSYAAKIAAVDVFKAADINRAISFDARQQQEGAFKYQDIDLNDEVTIIATSGSSGEPKAALHTWGNHFYSAQGSNDVIALISQDRWVLSLPFYHVAGISILARCLLAGASLVVMVDDDLGAAIRRSKATHISLVATQLLRLLSDDQNHAVLKSFKAILLGGSAIPQSLIKQSLDLGLNIYLSYGLTEMSSQVATGKPQQLGKACAKVLPYRKLRVAADGEICVGGETLFKGYVSGGKINGPGEWFATGDLGILDDQGCLTVIGRRDHMFISGGENIQPEEIEKTILKIEGIVEAIVVAKEDKEFGFRPVAFVKFQGAGMSEEELKNILARDLPRFKIPVCFYPWPSQMMEKGIKISRKDLESAFSKTPSRP